MVLICDKCFLVSVCSYFGSSPIKFEHAKTELACVLTKQDEAFKKFIVRIPYQFTMDQHGKVLSALVKTTEIKVPFSKRNEVKTAFKNSPID
jgi:hypothetical protein